MSSERESDPRRDTNRRVAELFNDGRSPAEIATALDISRQRVYQHLKRLREEASR